MKKINKYLLLSFCFVTSNLIIADPIQTYDDMVGPAMFDVQYSDPFGVILNGHWVNYLTPSNAFGFEVNFGNDEFRLGGTLTHNINVNNRFKITAEHFAQRFDFDYAAAPDQHWAGQNDFAGIYQYLFNNNVLKTFSLGAFYTNAESENTGNAVFSNNNNIFYNLQRFAGANSGGPIAGVTLIPWTSSYLIANVMYDRVDYDTHYEPNKDSEGVGATLGLQQLLTDHLKLQISGTHLPPYNMFQGGIFWLLNTRPGTRMELNLSGSHLNGDIFTGSDSRVMMGFAYSWGGNCDDPRANYADEDPDNFIAWTAQPAIYMPAVLVQKDELVLRRGF